MFAVDTNLPLSTRIPYFYHHLIPPLKLQIASHSRGFSFQPTFDLEEQPGFRCMKLLMLPSWQLQLHGNPSWELQLLLTWTSPGPGAWKPTLHTALKSHLLFQQGELAEPLHQPATQKHQRWSRGARHHIPGSSSTSVLGRARHCASC